MSADSVYVDPRVQKVRQLYEDLFDDDFYLLPIRKQLELQADRLAEAHDNRDDSVLFQISSWHPQLVGKPDAQILDYRFTIDDARTTIAREYGFMAWGEVESLQVRYSDPSFEETVNTMLAGDLPFLKEQIMARPGLPCARSRYGHGATLLHYAGTNGVESYRQVVPMNLADIVDFLVLSGSDPNSSANIYGRSTPRALFESSKHSYEAKVHEKVVGVFKKHER
jgi:hypothetical protein